MKKFLIAAVSAGAAAGALMLLLRPGGGSRDRSLAAYNLLVVTLDTTRADHVGAYGYRRPTTPRFDGLAREGVLFENCYTPVPVTFPAHSSLFTGRYPPGHGARDNGTYVLSPAETTLAEAMRNSGRHTFAAIASFVLLGRFGLNQGFDRYDDALDSSEAASNLGSQIGAGRVYEKFQSWFRQRPSGPFCAWIHFYDAHEPYEPPEPFRRFGSELPDLYDGEVACADHYLGKIIDDLRRSGDLEQTLVVVAGDHGEAFGEHGDWGHALLAYQEDLLVPLVFYAPRFLDRGRRVHDAVDLVDLLPTLLDLFALAKPERLHGVSLASLLTGGGWQPPDRALYFETLHGREEFGWAPLTGLLDGDWKFTSLPEPELYRLSADPGEKENLFWKKNRQARDLDARLGRLAESYSASRFESRRSLTAGDRMKLEALGYISAFSGKKQSGLDPKRGVRLIRRYAAIGTEIKEDRLDDAEAHLRELLRENPANRMPQYYGRLADIFTRRNDHEALVRTWREAMAAYPDNQFFRLNLGIEYVQQGRLAEADRLASDLIAEDATFTQAHVLRAQIAEKNRRFDEAVAHLEKAQALEPSNAVLKLQFARNLNEVGQHARAAAIGRELLADASVLASADRKTQVAHVLAMAGAAGEAQPLLEQAVAAGRDDAQTWNDLGVNHFRSGDYPQALADFKKSLSRDDQAAQTHVNLGALFTAMAVRERSVGQLRQAIGEYDRALELDGRLAAAWNGRASALRFAGRIADALRDWRRAVELAPGFADAYFNLAVTLLETGNRAEAGRWLARCRERCAGGLSEADRQRLDRLAREAEGAR